ncbi:MAG TPA: large conductance mechanosensitive channel protein MscL [Candidatus Saccharimonadales bacterium]|nr:large conductance mechanosensitive channel protein MscL [Candidatus Saccharimonadales bacterium]
MIQEFKKFILRGNVVDLAVAVVIGAAFTAVVNALVRDLITPLIAAIGGKPDFASLKFTIHHSQFLYGDFLNALVAFIILAAVVFFLVVTPVNKFIALSNRRKRPVDPTTRKCPECLSEVPVGASRCAFCTAKITPTAK